MIIWTRSI